MDYYKITSDYYGKWLGISKPLESFNGVSTIYSAERNIAPQGYTDIYDIWMLRQPDRIVISHGDKAAEGIAALANELDLATSADDIMQLLQTHFTGNTSHNIKFVYTHDTEIAGNKAVLLTESDCGSYEDFFVECHGCKRDSWIAEYFLEMTDRGLCYGVFEDAKLVCVNDTPGMPYMQELAQEIGINTLPQYRGKGYAKMVCAKAAAQMSAKGLCPMWATTVSNIASQRLAHAIGFDKFADVFTVTLTEA